MKRKTLIILFLLSTAGCDTLHVARIKPDDGIELKEYTAVGYNSKIESEAEIFGINSCCDVVVRLRNASSEQVEFRPSSAKLASACAKDHQWKAIVAFHPPGIQTFKDLANARWKPDANSSAFFERVEGSDKILKVQKGEALEVRYIPNARLTKECLPYSFKLAGSNGPWVDITAEGFK